MRRVHKHATRERKVVFVNARPGISLADVVEVLDETAPAEIVSPETNRVIALASRSGCLLDAGCGQCVNWQLNQRLP